MFRSFEKKQAFFSENKHLALQKVPKFEFERFEKY